jgi:hypothetical protein
VTKKKGGFSSLSRLPPEFAGESNSGICLQNIFRSERLSNAFLHEHCKKKSGLWSIFHFGRFEILGVTVCVFSCSSFRLRERKRTVHLILFPTAICVHEIKMIFHLFMAAFSHREEIKNKF